MDSTTTEPNTTNYPGRILGLVAQGAQDIFMQQKDIYYNMSDVITNNHRYQRVFSKLDFTKKTCNEKNTNYILTVNRTCDFINNLTLMIQNPENIEEISVLYGGQRFDRAFSWEQLQINMKIFKQKWSCNGDNYMIPLCISPFYSHLLAQPSTQHHKLEIYVNFKQKYTGPIELYANMFYFIERKKLYNEHEFVSFQTQYTGEEKLVKGVNKFKLHYNHPVCLLYFYGFDKSKIKNIKFILDNNIYYNGTIHELDHIKENYGYGDIDATMLIFAIPQKPHEIKNGTINFSRIDYPEIEIETDEDEADFHIFGLTVQAIRYSSGMYGVVFSK